MQPQIFFCHTLEKLGRTLEPCIVQNAVARVLTRSRKYDHITPILQSLHWLPIKFRISYKLLLPNFFFYHATIQPAP